MLMNTCAGQVWLATGATDMRKSINTLALLVTDVLEMNPVSPHWFVFCGRGRDRLKILQWDNTGFWLHYRRLERGRFVWPMSLNDTPAIAITARQLRWLLDGLDWPKAIGHLAIKQCVIR